MSSIYQDIILEHYRHPHNHGTIEHPSVTVSVKNPLCGDLLHMQAVIDHDIVKDIRFSGSGCAISQASASMLTDYAKGKTNDDLRKLDKDDVLAMLGIELSPNRLKCALLSLEGLQQLIRSYGKS